MAYDVRVHASWVLFVQGGTMVTPSPIVAGIVALVVMWIVSRVTTGKFNPLALCYGHNDAVSTSQLQFLLFTALTVFAYVAVATARLASSSGPTTLPGIPENLLILMGLAGTTAATSKGIAVSYIAQGSIHPEDNSTVTKGRDGKTDLTKVQMIMWTIVAAVIYLFQVLRFLKAGQFAGVGNTALPDVDGALLVLMGVSQGTYVGGKLVSKTAGPVIDRRTPSSAKAGDTVQLYGVSFGDSAAKGDAVFLNGPKGAQTSFVPSDWSDKLITFPLPSGLAAGDWQVKVRVNGVTSAAKTLEVTT